MRGSSTWLVNTPRTAARIDGSPFAGSASSWSQPRCWSAAPSSSSGPAQTPPANPVEQRVEVAALFEGLPQHGLMLGPASAPATLTEFAAAASHDRLWPFVDAFYRNQGPENSGYADDAFLQRTATVAGIDVAAACANARPRTLPRGSPRRAAKRTVWHSAASRRSFRSPSLGN